MENVKVSVIVPVCNVAKILKETLNSLINQTLHDIEIICVDDCSTDGSIDILKEYENKDSRVHVIYHPKNLGTSQTRKDGVGISKGQYIMFLDGDDTLHPKACEKAFSAINSNKVDMVQFGTKVVNCGGMTEARIKSNENALKPFIGKIHKSNLLFSCWKDKKFGFTLWNKIYNGDICRSAFSMVEDGYFPKAQDLYAFFVIAYLSESYMGIEDQLYYYNFGLGVTGGDIISLNKYDILLTEKYVAEALKRFITKKGEEESLRDIVDGITNNFLNECVNRWKNNLSPEAKSEGFHHLIETWGRKNVICKLAENDWFNRSNIAEQIIETDYFNYTKRPNKKRLTIAAYYQSINNGGAQRVVANLCNIWSSMKDSLGNPLYNVVLITDCKAETTDYPLNSSVQRAYVPHYNNHIRANYRTRYDAWTNIIDTYDIDIVVSGMWVAPMTLWDMLTIKGHEKKPAFILHMHSFCCVPYRYNGSTALELTYLYQLCDGVVTLSECDKRLASSFSNHTKVILNPLTFAPDSISETTREKNTLVWCGRISAEKRPLDAIHTMHHVTKKVPDAHLYIVGSGNETIQKNMISLIDQYGLENNVEMVGFTTNTEEYYSKANVFLGTSEYEGFSLTFCEAMAHAVPIVTYDLPWLTLTRDGRGIISVKQKRYDLLAEEIVKLFDDQNKAKELGLQGKQQLSELAQIDIATEWKEFFDSIPTTTDMYQQLSNEDILFKYMSIYQQIGKNSARSALEAENKKLKEQLNIIQSSTTFRVGKLILFIPIKIKLFVKNFFKN